MDWIFDNLQLIVVIGSGIAWWLMQNKEQADDDPPSRSNRDLRGDPLGDPDALERTRRIQEDIRRKIAERQRGQTGEAPPPMPRAPEPELPPIIRHALGLPPEPPRTPPPMPSAPVQSHDRSSLDRQERMQQEMRELEATRREAEAKVREVSARTARKLGQRRAQGAGSAVAPMSHREILTSLRDPRGARSAMVLREVLGKPVGLR